MTDFSTVPPLRTKVERGSSLLAQDGAVLEWDGTTIRFFRDTDGTVFFDVPPSQITRVRVDQGAAIMFDIDGTKYHAIFPEQANILASNSSAFESVVLARTHAMMQTTPARGWIEILVALGVKVTDNSFAPDPRNVIKWTMGVMGALVAGVLVVIVVVILLKSAL